MNIEQILIECGFEKTKYGDFEKKGFRYKIGVIDETQIHITEDYNGVSFKNIYTKQDFSDLLKLIG